MIDYINMDLVEIKHERLQIKNSILSSEKGFLLLMISTPLTIFASLLTISNLDNFIFSSIIFLINLIYLVLGGILIKTHIENKKELEVIDYVLEIKKDGNEEGRLKLLNLFFKDSVEI